MKYSLLKQDQQRYERRMPLFQKYLRKCQDEKNSIKRLIFKVIYRLLAQKSHIEIYPSNKIGGAVFRTSLLYYN